MFSKILKWFTELEPKNCFECFYCKKRSNAVAFCLTCLDKTPKGIYYSDTGFHCKPSIVDQCNYIYSLKIKKNNK